MTTTVTLMIPAQTMTVDEPDDALERDLLAWVDPDTTTAPSTAQNSSTPGGDAHATAIASQNSSGPGGDARTAPAADRAGPRCLKGDAAVRT